MHKNACSKETSDNTAITCESWSIDQKRPKFKFWFLIYWMELTIIILIRSFGESNFRLYHEEPIPFVFAENKVNYARWLPMMYIDEQHPEVARKFHKGGFVVHKSTRDFFAQVHEQNNVVIRGNGGAVCLTENPSAPRRWMVVGWLQTMKLCQERMMWRKVIVIINKQRLLKNLFLRKWNDSYR